MPLFVRIRSKDEALHEQRRVNRQSFAAYALVTRRVADRGWAMVPDEREESFHAEQRASRAHLAGVRGEDGGRA